MVSPDLAAGVVDKRGEQTVSLGQAGLSSNRRRRRP
jgi:hypothetical protein